MRKRLLDICGLLSDYDFCSAVGSKGVLLYELLWSISEDSGVYEHDPRMIANAMRAVETAPGEAQVILDKLSGDPLRKAILFNAGGKTYGWLVNLRRHQTFSNSPAPKFPLPPWITCEIKKVRSRSIATYEVLIDKLPEEIRHKYTIRTGEDGQVEIVLPKQSHEEYMARATTFFENPSGSWWKRLKDAHPKVDLTAEAKKALTWLDANPKHRRNNLKRFFANWLNRTETSNLSSQKEKSATVKSVVSWICSLGWSAKSREEIEEIVQSWETRYGSASLANALKSMNFAPSPSIKAFVIRMKQ